MEPNQIMESVKVKERFIERYKQLTNYDLFMKYSLTYLRRAIRVNTLKITVDELKERLKDRFILEKVPWCKEGFWITHKKGRRDIGNTIEHMLGYYYIQEPASMIPPIVLDPKPGDTVLDMAAAPGSKATQIAMYMKNDGLLIANDINAERLKPLGMNIQRMGVMNAIVTMSRGHKFKNMSFDKILLDAPCSGTGTIRKSLKTLRIWNPNMVRRINAQQKQLIETAYGLLKPGGIMVYSTCTLEPEENEGTITYLLDRFKDADIMEVELDIKRSEPVMEFLGEKYDDRVKHCLRIWPQDNDTEGFFVCKIIKKQ